MAFQGSDRTLTIAWQIVNGKWPGESLSLPLALFHHYCRRYSPGPAYSDGGGGPVLLITALRGHLLLSCATLSPYRCALRTLRIGIILIITFCPIRCKVDPRCRHPWHHVYRCVDVVGGAKKVGWGNCELREESMYLHSMIGRYRLRCGCCEWYGEDSYHWADGCCKTCCYTTKHAT